jgi:predicted ABC-type exoprotein transport system permease subunit
MPQESPAQRALNASTLALVVAVVALLLFLPPFFERYLTAAAFVVGNALVLSTALLLHWVFLAIGARRMQRSAAGWVALAVALFPIGGAAALILLGWIGDETGEAAHNPG